MISHSYTAPKVTEIIKLSLKSELKELFQDLPTDEKTVLSGTSSVKAYAVMGTDEWPSIYTTNTKQLAATWKGKAEPTTRFVDIELRQTKDPTVYDNGKYLPPAGLKALHPDSGGQG